MSVVIADRELDVPQDVQVIHALRGRLRVHLANWTGKGQWCIESRRRALAGVRSAQANPLTDAQMIRIPGEVLSNDGMLRRIHLHGHPSGDEVR